MFLSGFCLVAIGSFVLSCKDTTPSLNETAVNAATEVGLLHFRDVKAYENLISLHAQRDMKAFDVALSQTEGYTQMNTTMSGARKNVNEDIKSGFLRRILNKDGAVQIDKWIIKVDPKNSQCRVILAKNYSENLYRQMIDKVANPLVYTFADNYDVLDLLKEGYTSVPNTPPNGKIALFCGGGIGDRRPGNESQSYVHQYVDGNDDPKSTTIVFIGKIIYAKYGIYFECDFHLENKYSWTPFPQINNTFDVRYTCDAYCRTNCRNYWEFSCNLNNTVLPLDESDHSSGDDQDGYDFMRHRLYQGTRGLKCLRALTRYSINTKQNPSPTPEILTAEVVDAGCQP
ncbi:MAG: hypothetical protein EAZ91_23490 [Cytophagales bacterium]|nr:MAG: hypothetical protein EAZ91_23490 [Cytophagales bacterium]